MEEHYYYLLGLLTDKIRSRSTHYNPYLEEEIEQLQYMIQIERDR